MIYDFKCPGCGRACQLDTSTNGMRHERPTCAVYNATRNDGQKFLQLAYKSDANAKAFPAVLRIGGTS